MAHCDNPVYQFGPFRLDCRTGTLYRGEEIVPISPKAFETLRLLVENGGRTVEREWLLDSIWGDAVVEEANLTQTIFMLRKALGEPHGQPRYIRTVPRQGYQFVAPLRRIEEEAMPPPSAPARWRWPGLLGRLSMGLIAAGVVLLLALVALNRLEPGLWRSTRSSSSENGAPGARARGTAPERLLLVPFSVPEGDGDLKLLALSITDLLIQRLSGVPDLLPVTPSAGSGSGLVKTVLGSPVAISGVDYAIRGSLERSEDGSGGHLVLDLQHRSISGQIDQTPLGQYDIPLLAHSTTISVLTHVRDQIVRQVLRDLLPAIHIPSERPGMTPHNPEAYRLYLSALSQLRQASCTGGATLALLNLSLGLDSDFAPAWDALGWAHENLSTFCGLPGSHYGRALEAASRAIALAPEWPRPVTLKAVVLAETGRVEEAYALLSREGRDFSSSPAIAYMSALVLRYAGYLGRARERLDQALALEPVFLTLEGWTPNTLLYRGQWEAFLQKLPPGHSPVFLYYRAFTEYLRGRTEAALQVLRPASFPNPNDIFAQLSEALRAILRADDARARLILKRLILHRSSQNLADGEVTYKIGQLLLMAGDTPTGLEQIREAVDQGFFNHPYMMRDPVLERVRQLPALAKILERCRHRHLEFGKRFRLQPRG